MVKASYLKYLPTAKHSIALLISLFIWLILRIYWHRHTAKSPQKKTSQSNLQIPVQTYHGMDTDICHWRNCCFSTGLLHLCLQLHSYSWQSICTEMHRRWKHQHIATTALVLSYNQPFSGETVIWWIYQVPGTAWTPNERDDSGIPISIKLHLSPCSHLALSVSF